MRTRIGRWRFESPLDLVLIGHEAVVDGIRISEPGTIESARVESVDSVIAATAHHGDADAAQRKRHILAAYCPREVVPEGIPALWLAHGALVGECGDQEELAMRWSLPELPAELMLETCVIDQPDVPDLFGALVALQGITDLHEHGIDVTVIHAGERLVDGLLGEELRYRMESPSEDVVQAIWCYRGASRSRSEPWTRVELTAPAVAKSTAESTWNALLAGLERDTRA